MLRSVFVSLGAVLLYGAVFALAAEGGADREDGRYDFGGATAEALALYRQGWVEILFYGRWEEAERLYRAAVAANPDFLIARSVLARISADGKERDALFADVERQFDSVDPEGQLLLHTYQRTLELFARRERGESPEPAERRAMARRAVDDYRRFLERYPGEWSVMIEYVEWVHALEGPGSALAVIQSLADKADSRWNFSYFPAWFEAERGNHARASALAAQFTGDVADARAPQPYFLQAYLAQQRGDTQAARQQVEQALRLDPRHLLARRLQGEIARQERPD